MTISSVIALASTNPNLDLNNPATKKQIANKLVDLEVCQQKLVDTTAAYDNCAFSNHPVTQFWQTPAFVIGGFAVSVSATVLIMCATHLMGACK
jgi:hypothetical protein